MAQFDTKENYAVKGHPIYIKNGASNRNIGLNKKFLEFNYKM